MTRVINLLAPTGHEQVFKPQVNADHLGRNRQRFGVYLAQAANEVATSGIFEYRHWAG